MPKLFSNATLLQKHNTNIDKFFEEYLKEKHTEKDLKLLHGVYSNKEMKHEDNLNIDARRSLDSQISDNFCALNNESLHFSKINPKPLFPIFEQIDRLSSQMAYQNALNPQIKSLSINNKNKIEMSDSSQKINRSSLQFLEFQPTKT